MNKIEKSIYDLVKRTPLIKFLLRNIYQSFFDILPKKKEFFANSYQYAENCFFGFHDIDPFSSDCTKILTNRTILNFRIPGQEDLLDLGYFELENGNFGNYHSFSHSYAWNFHKGCRLQWYSANEVIFNTAIKNKLVSIIHDINTNIERTIDYPIDSINQTREIATSFSYERLERCMPGYGYPYMDFGHLEEFTPEETGIFIVNLRNNSRRLLISINSLVKELNDKKFEKGYWHFVTHSEFSHDGRYLSFLHRWVGTDIKKRWTRLVIYDLDSDSWFCLPTTDWGVSHYVWNTENQILAYCSLDNIDSHVLFDVISKDSKKIAVKRLNSDGHQSFINKDCFITDTYPDKYRMSKLFKVNINNDTVETLLSIYSPKKFQTRSYFKHIACDLHPRVSKNGSLVCFDSPRTGLRGIYVMEIN